MNDKLQGERARFEAAWPEISKAGIDNGWRGVAEAAWQAALASEAEPDVWLVSSWAFTEYDKAVAFAQQNMLPIEPRFAATPSTAQAVEAMREKCAAWVDKRREDFDAENGYEDSETGAFEYGTGPHAQAKEEYSAELYEIAEGIRAIPTEAAIASANQEG